MTSYIFSVIEKRVIWSKVIEILKNKYDDFQVVFAVNKKNPDCEEILSLQNDFIKVLIFDKNTSENKMIMEALKQISGDSLVLCRDYFEYATVLSDFLIDMGQKGAQVAMFKQNKKKNKFEQFVNKMYEQIVGAFFNFTFYKGDIGLIFFNKIALAVMKETPSILFTKVNRFAGFEISYGEMEELKKPNPEWKTKKKEIIKVTICVSFLVVLILALSMFIVFDLMNFVIGLFFVMGILLDCFWLLYLCVKMEIIKKVGDLT